MPNLNPQMQFPQSLLGPTPSNLDSPRLNPGPPAICAEINKSASASSSRGLRGADRTDSRPAKIGRWPDDVPVRRRFRLYRNGGPRQTDFHPRWAHKSKAPGHPEFADRRRAARDGGTYDSSGSNE